MAKKVGYNTAETAKARFRQMKRKFNNGHSIAPQSPSPSKARTAPKTGENNRGITNSSSFKVTKPKPLTSRVRKPGYTKSPEFKSNTKRTKTEKVDVQDGAGGDTDGSFADIDDCESE